MEYVILYLCIINIITFILYGFDKKRAKQKGRRIPEKVLLGLAAAGGAIGALAGMQAFRHKIRKWKFALGVPFMFVLQIATIIYFGFAQ